MTTMFAGEFFNYFFVLITCCVNLGNCGFSHFIVKKNQVFYKLDPQFKPEEKEYIQRCFKEIQSKSCLEWKDLNAQSESINAWVELVRADEPTSCNTFVQPQRPARVTLSPHCFQDGWVVHELLHALGFDHEHQRRDRDCYVEVHSSKWNDSAYSIIKSASTDLPYDIHSVMHYRRGPFLQPTADFPDQHADFGSKDVLTNMDEWKLNYEFCNGPHFCEKNKEECDELNKSYKKKKCIH